MGGKNRIVVDYGDFEGCILTAVFNTETGEEQSLYVWDLPIATSFNLDTPLQELYKTIAPNEEGYVVRFDNGERVKIKGEEYLRLHKIMSDVSTKSVWECLKKGDDISSIIQGVPDEYFDKIKQYSEELLSRFEYTKSWIELEYLTKYRDIPSSKELAFTIKDLDYKHFIFALYNNKDISVAVWDKIKPEYNKL